MNSMAVTINAVSPKCVCSSERAKLIGTTDGLFPDFGHHIEKEMGGLWMQPIKVLDGFWFRFHDLEAENVDTWITADSFTAYPWGNVFDYRGGLGHTKVTIRRTQLAPDSAPGLVVSYCLRNRSDASRRVEAELLARTELHPAWFSLDCGFCQDGQDEGEYDPSTATFRAKDQLNPWHAAVRCARKPDRAEVGQIFGPQVTAGQGVSVLFHYDLTLPAWGEEMLTFYMTGSFHNAQEAEENLTLLASGRDFRAEKQAHYDRMLALSRLTVADSAILRAWDWGKVHIDWLTVDAGEYGRAMAAGLPEYMWWFGCDSCYTIQGLLCAGQYDLARQSLKLIADYSARINGNGRIVHEITPYGLCPNPGNTQETAHFVTAVWHYWQWTGDRSLVDELLPLLRQSMAWLTQMDDDGDLFPSGYGIIEIAGLNAEMIDTIVYTAQAWGCYADMCALAGDDDEARAARERFTRTRDALNTQLWDEEAGLYCDAYASPAFVRSCRERILSHRRAPSDEDAAAFDEMVARKEAACQGEAGFLINGNWVIDTPMETGLAPLDKAERALAAMDTPAFVGPWGVYLNALDQGAMMTISTGVLAVAQARYGHGDRALALLHRMADTFGKIGPALLAEMSPDYGCMVQAWTAYALYVPVVRHMFGIQPAAQEVFLTPAMPAAWPSASLHRVRALDGEISMDYTRTPGGYDLAVRATPGLKVHLRLHPGETAENLPEGGLLPDGGATVRVRCNEQGKEDVSDAAI